jgi:hypothetical protein
MKSILIIFSSLFIIISSCKKDEKENIETLPYTEVYGKVISTGSLKPVEGVRVSIWDGLPDTGPLSSGSYKSSGEYDTTITNSGGSFHIGVHGKEPVLYLYKKGYTFKYSIEGVALGVAPLIAGKIYNDEVFNLDGIAYFNPILMNRIKQKYDDTLKITLLWWKDHSIPAAVTHTFVGNGPSQYFVSVPDGDIVLGDSFVPYKIEYQRENNWNTFIDSVYIKLGEVYKDTIYY